MEVDDKKEGGIQSLPEWWGVKYYIERALAYVYKFTQNIWLPQGENVLEISEQVITPSIVCLDDSYPIIQCRKRIFSRKNGIEISYGIVVMLGMLGEFERTVRVMMGGEMGQKDVSMREVWKLDISNLVDCVKAAFRYLEQSYNSFPGTVPEIPPLTLSTDILGYALEFIVGHEMAHYLDPYYNFDFRDNQQGEVVEMSYELLEGLKSSPYKRYADEFLNRISKEEDAQGKFYTIWSEEVLADFEGYQYLCPKAPKGYVGMRKIMAMSLSFLSMRIVEYFESTVRSEPKEMLFVPVKWRATFLQYIIYKNYGSKYEYFSEFVNNEWGMYQILSLLFERVILAMESEKETEKETEKEPGEEEQDSGIADDILCCERLIEKMSSSPISEAENVYREINEIFKRNLLNKQFLKAFNTKKIAEVMCDFGQLYYKLDKYDKSHQWYYRASTFYETTDSQEWLLGAKCYYGLGIASYAQGNYGASLGWFNEVLSIRKFLGIPFKENIEINLWIARALIADGRGESAADILKAINDVTEDGHIRAEVFRNMGVICENQEDYEGALEWFVHALDIILKMQESDDLETAVLYNHLANILSILREFDIAEYYFEQSSQIISGKIKENGLLFTDVVYNMGMMDLRRGNYQWISSVFQNVLDIRVQYYGDRHPLVADVFRSIGMFYYLQENYSMALDYHKKALEIYENRLDKNHFKIRRDKQMVDEILCLMDEAKE